MEIKSTYNFMENQMAQIVINESGGYSIIPPDSTKPIGNYSSWDKAKFIVEINSWMIS